MPQWNKHQQDVPFDKDGNQLGYDDSYVSWTHDPDTNVYSRVEHTRLDWQPNFEFADTLILSSYYKGRSSAGFEFVRKSNGKRVLVFMRDIVLMMQRMVRGEVADTFTFSKVGKNYGCKIVQDANGQ